MRASSLSFGASVLPSALSAATLGACAGAAGADWLPVWPVLFAFAACFAVLGLTLRRPRLFLAVLALVFAQFGAWRMQTDEAKQASASQRIAQLSGIQQIRGLVADDPVNRGRTTSVRLSDVLVRTDDRWLPLSASVLLSVPSWPEHEYGEYLQVRGRLQPLNGSGALEALRRQGVLASMNYPKVSYLANPLANPVLIAMFRLRQRLSETIDQTLPDPAASTLKATVLGLRSALPKSEQQALVDTGTVHLVAISGFKLSLLAAALQLLGLWLLRRTTAKGWARLVTAAAVLTAIAGYTLLTGASPSAVRAAIMAGVVVLAVLAGRPRDQLTALALAVLVIVLARPFELQDGGFQLSSLSVLGIALLAEPLMARFDRVRRWLPDGMHGPVGVLTQAAAVSTAATAFDLPVLAGSFHIVSLVSPLANLLGMPLLGPVMVFGGLGALLGSVIPVAGAALLWPAWAFVTLLDRIVHFLAVLPYAALPMPELPVPVVFLYYGLLLGLVWWLRREQPVARAAPPTWLRRTSWAALGVGALATACVSAAWTQPPSTLRATFMAVPGQATLIQTPSGTKVLVDGASDGQSLLRQLGTLLPPWDRTIDAVLLTSVNTEHLGGLEDLFARYRIGAFVTPDGLEPSVTLGRLIQTIAPVAVQQVDLGEGSLLMRTAGGWELQHGGESILLAPNASDVRTRTGSWRIMPILKGAPAAEGDDLLALAETGTVTITFAIAPGVDS